MKYGTCARCEKEGIVEYHHIVSRKQQPAMRDCKMNLIELCYNCHRGDDGAHGKNLEVVQKELKLGLQKKMFKTFDKDLVTIEDIKEKLEIKEKEVFMLIRLLYPVEGALYKKEDVIRAVMGGKLVI